LSAQSYPPDPRNEQVLVWLDGALVPRHEAKVSVFDAGFVCGDGVWEGVRLVDGGRIVSLAAHLDRLFEGAAKIALDLPAHGYPRERFRDVLREAFAANGMHDGAHARLMVTRGPKRTPNQDPRFQAGGPTVVCVAEWKAVVPLEAKRPLVLVQSTRRTSDANTFDMRLNSHSRLNLIGALLEAIDAGADEALMPDPHGAVASGNSTNFFWVREGTLHTSGDAYCFNGITRGSVLRVVHEAGIPVAQGSFGFEAVRGADEAFLTGTLGGLTPVARLDGVPFGAAPGPLTRRLDALYRAAALAGAEAP
jgi:branched-chain amino acid aminotransferase